MKNMILVIVSILVFSGCGSSDNTNSNNTGGGGTTGGGTTGGGGATISNLLTADNMYTYLPQTAKTIAESMPDELITGGISSTILGRLTADDVSVNSVNTNYSAGVTRYITWGNANTPPWSIGSIAWLVWDLDYIGEGTEATVQDGTCFRVRQSMYDGSNDNWDYYCKPLSLRSGNENICLTASSSSVLMARSGTSIISKACQFDYDLKGSLINRNTCDLADGKSVDLTAYLPWAETWNLPSTVLLTTGSSSSTYGFWVNTKNANTEGVTSISLTEGTSMSGLQFVQVNKTTNDIIWILVKNLTTQPVQTMQAYMGQLAGTNNNMGVGSFEAMSMNHSDDGGDAMRLKSNGTYIWYQNWDSIPGLDNWNLHYPQYAACAKLATNIPSSYWVNDSECISSFNVNNVQELNDDSFYRLSFNTNSLNKNSWVMKGDTWYSVPENAPVQESNTCYDSNSN